MNTYSTSLYNGNRFIGEVVITPARQKKPRQNLFPSGLRVSVLSASSERVQPIVALHTMGDGGLWFKLSPKSEAEADWHEMDIMHNTCITEAKTAVVKLADGRELHLVAMLSKSRKEHRPCFWAYVANEGQYGACLSLLNLRVLAIVFDLDETLIVANTMRSFDDKMEALERRMRSEPDAGRRAMMAAEHSRYQEDRDLLRQYYETDEIMDNGVKEVAQLEVVPSSGEGVLPFMRPIIRLPNRSMILTRIDPNVRDTSVLVRFRPSWDELRKYVVAKGRKRFEAFVCTMSEKQYALEMWRLLDPGNKLIPAKDLQERVVCVKSDAKKSLENVFHKHQCHPRMAMVVDDRLKVWEDSDQDRVHVLPAFAPYYNPQAEASMQMPVLCTVRNVACNVRGGFYKEVDEVLSQQMVDVRYDVDVQSLPRCPDVGLYVQMPLEGFAATLGSANGAPGPGEEGDRKQPSQAVSTIPANALSGGQEVTRANLQPAGAPLPSQASEAGPPLPASTEARLSTADTMPLQPGQAPSVPSAGPSANVLPADNFPIKQEEAPAGRARQPVGQGGGAAEVPPQPAGPSSDALSQLPPYLQQVLNQLQIPLEQQHLVAQHLPLFQQLLEQKRPRTQASGSAPPSQAAAGSQQTPVIPRQPCSLPEGLSQQQPGKLTAPGPQHLQQPYQQSSIEQQQPSPPRRPASPVQEQPPTDQSPQTAAAQQPLVVAQQEPSPSLQQRLTAPQAQRPFLDTTQQQQLGQSENRPSPPQRGEAAPQSSVAQLEALQTLRRSPVQAGLNLGPLPSLTPYEQVAGLQQRPSTPPLGATPAFPQPVPPPHAAPARPTPPLAPLPLPKRPPSSPQQASAPSLPLQTQPSFAPQQPLVPQLQAGISAALVPASPIVGESNGDIEEGELPGQKQEQEPAEEDDLPEVDLDEERRRQLILQHGMDLGPSSAAQMSRESGAAGPMPPYPLPPSGPGFQSRPPTLLVSHSQPSGPSYPEVSRPFPRPLAPLPRPIQAGLAAEPSPASRSVSGAVDLRRSPSYVDPSKVDDGFYPRSRSPQPPFAQLPPPLRPTGLPSQTFAQQADQAQQLSPQRPDGPPGGALQLSAPPMAPGDGPSRANGHYSLGAHVQPQPQPQPSGAMSGPPSELRQRAVRVSQMLREFQSYSGRPPPSNPISLLNEASQKSHEKVEFTAPVRTGPDNADFAVEVHLGGEKLAEGVGRNKKDARLQAAQSALGLLTDLASPGQMLQLQQLQPLSRPWQAEQQAGPPAPRRNPRDPRIAAGIAPPFAREGSPDEAPATSTSGFQPMGNEQQHGSEQEGPPRSSSSGASQSNAFGFGTITRRVNASAFHPMGMSGESKMVQAARDTFQGLGAQQEQESPAAGGNRGLQAQGLEQARDMRRAPEGFGGAGGLRPPNPSPGSSLGDLKDVPGPGPGLALGPGLGPQNLYGARQEAGASLGPQQGQAHGMSGGEPQFRDAGPSGTGLRPGIGQGFQVRDAPSPNSGDGYRIGPSPGSRDPRRWPGREAESRRLPSSEIIGGPAELERTGGSAMRGPRMGAGSYQETSSSDPGPIQILTSMCASEKLELAFKEPSVEGPSHRPIFSCQVEIAGQRVAVGTGHSKKAAKQKAAEEALRVRSLGAGMQAATQVRRASTFDQPSTKRQRIGELSTGAGGYAGSGNQGSSDVPSSGSPRRVTPPDISS